MTYSPQFRIRNRSQAQLRAALTGAQPTGELARRRAAAAAK